MDFKKVKFYFLLIMIVVSLSLFFFSGSIGLDKDLIQGSLSSDVPSMVIFFLWIVFATVTTFPISVILVPGIILFDFKVAILIGFLGIVVGALIVYYGTKFLGNDFIDDYIGDEKKKLKLVRKIISKNDFPILIILNCFYFFPSTLAYVVAAVSKIKFSRFILSSVIGNFLNFFFLGILTLGVYEVNYNYIFISVFALILTSLVPLIFYRKHIKEILKVSFS